MIDVNAIWNNHKPIGDKIVKTKVNEITHFNCFLATNHQLGNHFFILDVPKSVTIPDLSKHKFKSILVFSNENKDVVELIVFLMDNQLKDIFSLFIQDVLMNIDVSITEKDAVQATLNTVSEWQKLFEKYNPDGLTIEQQKGLIGELLFVNYLLDNNIEESKAIDFWTSVEQDFQSKDFSIGNVGVEIKFTSSKQPKLKISNEKQLDKEPFQHLFLVLYVANATKSDGISLNSIIECTKERFCFSETLVLFNNKLLINGYFEKDKENYNRKYVVEKTNTFQIQEDFPKITKSNLNRGIFDVSYSIEISSVEKHITDINQILKSLK